MQELAQAPSAPKTPERSYSNSFSVQLPERPRPGFVMGRVVAVSEDASCFTVRCSSEKEVKVVEVRRAQQVLPWPELLQLGRKNLRCVDWASQSPKLWKRSRDMRLGPCSHSHGC